MSKRPDKKRKEGTGPADCKMPVYTALRALAEFMPDCSQEQLQQAAQRVNDMPHKNISIIYALILSHGLAENTKITASGLLYNIKTSAGTTVINFNDLDTTLQKILFIAATKITFHVVADVEDGAHKPTDIIDF